jgi:hypothetical protein
MAVRLLFWTTSLVSVHTPGGLFRQHFTSSAIKGVQWKLSVGVAWCHGLLLPVGGGPACVGGLVLPPEASSH